MTLEKYVEALNEFALINYGSEEKMEEEDLPKNGELAILYSTIDSVFQGEGEYPIQIFLNHVRLECSVWLCEKCIHVDHYDSLDALVADTIEACDFDELYAWAHDIVREHDPKRFDEWQKV